MMGQAAIPLIIAGLGTGANYLNTRKLNKAQDAAASLNIQKQQRRDREADARVASELSAIEGGQGRSKSDIQADYVRQVAANRGKADSSLGVVPEGSERYQQGLADRVVAGDERTGRIAELMAGVDSATRQREAEGQGAARLGTDIEQLGRFSAGDDYTTNLRIRSMKANPWVKLAANAAQMYGTWAAGMPGGGYSSAASEAAGRGMSGYSLAGGL